MPPPLPPDSRARALIVQPWSRSTGPQTPAGKARAARNAVKHGLRSIEFKLLLLWAESVEHLVRTLPVAPGADAAGAAAFGDSRGEATLTPAPKSKPRNT